MDLTKAVSEPFIALITFHNAFNRNIKFAFGAMSAIQPPQSGHLMLPTGGEPWGEITSWPSTLSAKTNASQFIAELGIARAESAFEDFLTSVTAELDRAGIAAPGSQAIQIGPGIDKRLALPSEAVAALTLLREFFDCARNCVVHRSGRASEHLAQLASSKELANALLNWGKRRGSWQVSIPTIVAGRHIEWLPRHAILASDVYYRFGMAIDRQLVAHLGETGLMRMAAHWTLLAESRVPCQAHRTPQAMIRTVLQDRYKARKASQAGIVATLKALDIWKQALNAHRTIQAAR